MNTPKLLTLLALLAVPVVAMADFPYHKTSEQVTYLNAVALNAAEASRTFTIDNPYGEGGGWAYVNLELTRTRVAGTDLTLTCKSSTHDTAVPVAVRTACTYDGNGVCTSKTATRKSDTSASEVLAWTVTILGWRRTDCVVSSTAAGATDFITVKGSRVTK